MARHNEFEDVIEQVIRKHGNVQLIFPKESVRSMKVLKDDTNINLLFTDARSPHLTPTGRQKSTEFVYFAPNKADWRIECKSRKTYGLLGEITRELNFVADIPEKLYCLVLTDNLLTTDFLNELNQIVREKGLEDKVWIGGKKKFKKMLKRVVT